MSKIERLTASDRKGCGPVVVRGARPPLPRPVAMRPADWGNWTPERDATLLRLWPTMSAREVAIELGTTRNAVLSHYHHLWGNGKQYGQRQSAKRRAETQPRRDAQRQAEINALHDLKRNLAQGMNRDAAILTARTAGATCHAIGEALGLTQQRVAQIARRAANPHSKTTTRGACTEGGK
jgi:hypothetical protein